MTLIPTPALDSLLMAVEEAVTLAQEGDPAAGYECLLTGRARALEGERNFEPWAEAPAVSGCARPGNLYLVMSQPGRDALVGKTDRN
jgi:hypothetical protein